MMPSLYDLSLEQLRDRVQQLEEWGRVQEADDDTILGSLRTEVFALGGSEEDDWNDYHRVRNEYDRRAAEEFDLGQ
jgi:hypothetical protein